MGNICNISIIWCSSGGVASDCAPKNDEDFEDGEVVSVARARSSVGRKTPGSRDQQVSVNLRG